MLVSGYHGAWRQRPCLLQADGLVQADGRAGGRASGRRPTASKSYIGGWKPGRVNPTKDGSRFRLFPKSLLNYHLIDRRQYRVLDFCCRAWPSQGQAGPATLSSDPKSVRRWGSRNRLRRRHRLLHSNNRNYYSAVDSVEPGVACR